MSPGQQTPDNTNPNIPPAPQKHGDLESINEPPGSQVRKPDDKPHADPKGAEVPKHPHPDDKKHR